jgi:phosphatidylinositol-4-phosphate 3-kinase
LLWSHRYHLTHKPYALPILLQSCSFWDYPSTIDIYGLVHLIRDHRSIDEIESLQLLLPFLPDMYIRSLAYRSLISHLKSPSRLLYLPQLLQMIKFDYNDGSPIITYLLQQSLVNFRLAHRLYWYLRQLLQTEQVHFQRYYHIFVSLLYIVPDKVRLELQNESNLCEHLKRVGLEIKTNKVHRPARLVEQIKEINQDFFLSQQQSCRLPCQFSFISNGIDISSCSIFHSLTTPIKIVFNPMNSLSEKYSSIFKIGDDIRVSIDYVRCHEFHTCIFFVLSFRIDFSSKIKLF